jgi:predicted transcriptional regulator of viral defense system
MGEEKYKKEVEKLFKKSQLVSYNSIANIIKHKRGSKEYTKRMINYLLKKGLIKRITKGYYTSSDNISLAVLCFQPAYLGLQDALSFHDLWEQETVPIIITSRNIRTGIRTIMGNNILIRKIEKKHLFGINYYQQDNIALPYSDIEKTFIDMVVFNQTIDEEVLDNIKKRINKKKLSDYLKRYNPRTRKRVIEKIGF